MPRDILLAIDYGTQSVRALAFDLPAADVTPQHLQALYAQHLHELTGPALAADDDAFPGSPTPVAMNCR